MDRSARIVGVWIVGCMIVGGTLVIANVPLGEPWTDQQVWLVRLGLVTIGFGVLGMVAEFLVAMRAWRGRKPPPQIMDVTSATLAGYYRTHTAVQADMLLAPYKGQFIRVTGEVGDVTLDKLTRMVSLSSTTDPANIHHIARFSRKWTEQLTRLPKGQTITIVGRVGEVNGYVVVLNDARIEPNS